MRQSAPAAARGVGRTLGVVVILSAVVLSSCGQPAATNSPVVVRGAINGILRYGFPASCGPGPTRVVGTYGSDPELDAADLTVSDDGKISFDAGRRGVFSGDGVAFRPGVGWDIDAQLRSGLTRTITIKGHVSC
jgi:hypothetical protein